MVSMPSTHHHPLPRRLTTALETSTALDAPTRALRHVAGLLDRAPRVRALLRGAPLGHAAHPLLTDVPIGLWLSSTALDLVGSRRARTDADRLLALGVVAAVPTAVTGLADWAVSGARVQHVGTAHALLNNVALSMYAGSWVLRKRGRRGTGVLVSLAAAGVVGVSGYLGGHMAYVQRAPQG